MITRIRRRPAAPPPPARLEFDARHRILIVGTGPAGLSAAEELRRMGFTGELLIMGDEPEGPYDRPACSKGLLTGHQRPRDVTLPVDPSLDITWRLGRRAMSCDLDQRYVEAHTGEYVYFDGLVIANGCRPVVPMDWPDTEPGMHVLHGMPAAWELRRELRGARRVAVVGGGVTGCEVACAVHDLARESVIVEPRDFVMGRAVGRVIGELVTDSHRRSGIEVVVNSRVQSVTRNRGWWRLNLKNGNAVEADLVVAAMGERPDVEWLENTAIDVSDGVACDGALRAVDSDGIPVGGVVAAGSLARWPNPRADGRMVKCGQWIAAQEQGRHAAQTLLAGEQPVPALSLLPRYWSHQMGLRIEVCGELDETADVEVTELRRGRKLPARSGVIATYFRNGHLVGAAAVNAPRPFTTLAREMLQDEPPLMMVSGGTSREERDLGVTQYALPSQPSEPRWYPEDERYPEYPDERWYSDERVPQQRTSSQRSAGQRSNGRRLTSVG
jgi:NADPH-dependent 2,4-dienoyl-CoA reductase/sulfur reductase-like enzyme